MITITPDSPAQQGEHSQPQQEQQEQGTPKTARQPVYQSEFGEKQRRRVYYRDSGQRGPGTY